MSTIKPRAPKPERWDTVSVEEILAREIAGIVLLCILVGFVLGVLVGYLV